MSLGEPLLLELLVLLALPPLLLLLELPVSLGVPLEDEEEAVALLSPELVVSGGFSPWHAAKLRIRAEKASVASFCMGADSSRGFGRGLFSCCFLVVLGDVRPRGSVVSRACAPRLLLVVSAFWLVVGLRRRRRASSRRLLARLRFPISGRVGSPCPVDCFGMALGALFFCEG